MNKFQWKFNRNWNFSTDKKAFKISSAECRLFCESINMLVRDMKGVSRKCYLFSSRGSRPRFWSEVPKEGNDAANINHSTNICCVISFFRYFTSESSRFITNPWCLTSNSVTCFASTPQCNLIWLNFASFGGKGTSLKGKNIYWHQYQRFHFNDMNEMGSQITGNSAACSTVQQKLPRLHMTNHLWGESTSDRWIALE